MAWPSAGGPVTLTLEHIADCVRAGEDSLITPARLKIGHTDPRFADPNDPGHDPFYDGEPAYGSIANMRLTNDGATATGDYINVPKWLADCLPSAYPSRSVEGAYTIAEGSGGELTASWDVETPGGKKYSFVLTANSLLGVCAPAVKDIEDLQFRLTEGRGVIVTGDPKAGGVPIAVSMGAVPSAVSLEADIDQVIDAFCAEFCIDEHYRWWPRSMRVDPNVIVADDDEGSLFYVAIETDADQNITFGTPERRLQAFIPAPEAAAVLSAAAMQPPTHGRTVAVFSSREQTPLAGKRPLAAMEVTKSDSCPADMPWAVMDGDMKVSCHATKGEAEERMREMQGMSASQGGGSGSGNTSGMDFSELSDKQRTRLCASLELAADATDEQIGAALEADPEQPPATEPPAPDDPKTPETPEEPEEKPEEPTVPVDKTVLAELTANSELGRQAREKQVADHREKVLATALDDGKITPASKSAWAKKLKAAPEATEAELAELPKNLVPVKEIGHGGSTTDGSAAPSEAEFSAMFPGRTNRKAAA